MTLAAKERNGETFFKTSPQAYFVDNLKEQAAGRRTPPDWWRNLRKEEERRRWQADRDEREASDGRRSRQPSTRIWRRRLVRCSAA